MYGIKTFDNALPADFCNHVIEKFDQDGRKIKGLTAAGLREDIKVSDDLFITDIPDWAEEDQVFHASLRKHLELYVNEFFPECVQTSESIIDEGYNLQRTPPGGFYAWHNDFALNKERHPRLLTFIWYLNTVEEAGYTQFIDGTTIKPEQGKLLLFPATWCHGHRGVPPTSETKYIATGWVYGCAYTSGFTPPETR